MSALLCRERSQLLMIDVQQRLLLKIADSDGLVNRCVRLAAIADALAIPSTLSEQYRQGLGDTPEELRKLFEASAIFEKTRFSCLADERLERRLSTLFHAGRDQVIIAGVEGHICVLQTALQLVDNGYKVYVVMDAVDARAKVALSIAWHRMRQAGVQIIDIDMAAFEWMGDSDTAEFRSILPLVKAE